MFNNQETEQEGRKVEVKILERSKFIEKVWVSPGNEKIIDMYAIKYG